MSAYAVTSEWSDGEAGGRLGTQPATKGKTMGYFKEMMIERADEVANEAYAGPAVYVIEGHGLWSAEWYGDWGELEGAVLDRLAAGQTTITVYATRRQVDVTMISERRADTRRQDY